MQITVLKPRSSLVQKRCQAMCGRPVEAGQAVLHARLPTRDFADGSWVAHVDCVRAVIDRGPKGDVEVGDPRAALAARVAAAVAAGAT